MGDRPLRKRSATLERLLDAALATFAKSGIQSSTVEDICSAAGFTRGAFYSNFNSKEELVAAVLHREQGRILESISESLMKINPEDDYPIEQLLDAVFAALPRDPVLLMIQTELTLMALRQQDVPNFGLRTMNTELAAFIEKAAAKLNRRLLVSSADALSLINAVFEAGRRESLETGESPDALVRRLVPLVVAALTEPN